jgi:FkbM family methyltransferase
MMIRRAVRWAVRPAQRAGRILTGSHLLESRLERLEALVAALHEKTDAVLGVAPAVRASLDVLHEKTDAVLGAAPAVRASLDVLQAKADALPGGIAEELDRLDGYLVYHASRILDRLRVAEELLVGLHGKIDAVLGGLADLQRASGTVLYGAAELDAVVRLEGLDLVVPTRELGLLSYLVHHGTSAVEPAVRAALRRHLAPGMVAVDAGANIGLHSLVMAEAVGSSGRLLAFEPLPHLSRAVSRSLLLNGFSARATVVEAVLAERAGELAFHVTEHSPVSSLFAPRHVASTAIRVRATTLDDEIASDRRVDLVKMDIEGAEPLAWAGMTRVLAENPSLVVILEWSASHFSRSGQDPAVFVQAIRASGYSPWLLDDFVPDAPAQLDLAQLAGLEGQNLLLRRD